MPTRDQQEYERRRQQILDGALSVFASKGFAAATIKDIAAAAGIASPALIYHYFEDKAGVFRQLIEQRIPVFDLLGHPDILMALSPRELLTQLATLMLRASQDKQTVALMKLLLGESLRQADVALTLNSALPGRAFVQLRDYMERQMELGVLRRMDPGIAVRSFVGPFILYLLSREVFVMPDSATLTPDAMVAGAVETFLRGMTPE